jgi:hypothetical protein
MNEHLKTASHDRPFAGEISVRPDPLLQVMPETESCRRNFFNAPSHKRSGLRSPALASSMMLFLVSAGLS